jgi:hypothetical protein
MPVLYGVWHAYKHTLVVLHRTFFPIFGLLEVTGRGPKPGPCRLTRKVAFLEKMVAAILLATPDVEHRLQAKLQTQAQSVRALETARAFAGAIPSRLRVPLTVVCLPVSMVALLVS